MLCVSVGFIQNAGCTARQSVYVLHGVTAKATCKAHDQTKTTCSDHNILFKNVLEHVGETVVALINHKP